MNEVNVILTVVLFGIVAICIAISFIKELYNTWEAKKIIEKCYDEEYEDSFDFIIDILPYVINDEKLHDNILFCINAINFKANIKDLEEKNEKLKEMLDLNISASVEIVEGEEDDVDKRAE